MPWDIKIENGKHCVYKKTTGKIMHCYDNEKDAKDYLGALYANVSEKELKEFLADNISNIATFKEADGRYKIVAVSTAALKDRDGETFDVAAIDYDARAAAKHGDYPEFRMFHKKGLKIGKVEKMKRVGIFAVDEGHSYTDQFSLEVCEKMLSTNDGKWRTSRGFYVVEASGDCPVCKESLLIQTKHMVAGFRCPSCNAVHMSSRGVLGDMHFRKARTFDVTVTDNPSVPWTGVSAFKENSSLEDLEMTKQQLEKKLLDAGISKEAIAARLEGLSEEQLKEFSDIPFATMLKEFGNDAGEEEEYDTIALDEESLKEFGKIVRAVIREEMGTVIKEQVAAAIEGLEIDIADLGGMEVDFKEAPQFVELKEAVDSLTEKVEKLLTSDEQRLKEMLEETPRAGKLRIRRYKKASPPGDEEDDDEDDDEMDDDEDVYDKKTGHRQKESGLIIVGADGKTAKSMTEFVLGSE
jgi:hypothetical protein